MSPVSLGARTRNITDVPFQEQIKDILNFQRTFAKFTRRLPPLPVYFLYVSLCIDFILFITENTQTSHTNYYVLTVHTNDS
jgi:hypothetical protein